MAAQLKETHFGGCPHDCPDTCSMVFEVEDGKLTGVRGNKDHPMTRGGLCVKLKDYEKRHYHPDRLLYPMRRTGPKGSKQFERITWDEALDEIISKWKAIIDEHGPQAIIPNSYLGHQGLVHGLNGGDAFFNKMGATVCERTFCGEGSATAWVLTNGPTSGLDPESFIQSKYIIIWGCNSMSTNLHHWHFVEDARKKGAKVVVIDPYKSRTAKQADWHVRVKPGTDGALAMAMMNVIIEEGLVDQDYVDNYTVGYEELAARAKERTPEWAEEITGCPAEDIRTLAREFAKTSPAAIRVGVAVERNWGGSQAIRAICCLPSLTGAWREVGGGIHQMTFWEHPYALDVISRPDFIPEGTPVVNNLQIGRALTGELDLATPIMSMMCWNTNPVTQAPEGDKIIKGLEREDLFLVSAEHFLSDTAAYADIVLPAAMGSEMEDIILSWGHNFFTYNTKCTEPPGEALSNNEIFRRLAAGMGYEEDRFKWSDSECLENFINWDSPACEGIDLDYLREHGFARIGIGEPDKRTPHKEGNFPTPSGKCEFFSETASNGNFVIPPFRQMYEGMQPGNAEPLDSLPDYVASKESAEADPELAKKYPLNVIAPKSHGFLNSCYANMEHKIKGQGEQFVLISEDDASARGIKDGSQVRVFNDRGAYEGVAKISDDVSAGLVVSSLGYWRQLNKGTVNVVASADFGDMGHSIRVFDTLVEVAAV
ncbi:MAG: molybdopterin-dependent oxidoreductase [Gammaproteobacteria bacterium]|nr:molybdopterin-dependent oxidoreductase [Gammaproteobacteria bacterium]